MSLDHKRRGFAILFLGALGVVFVCLGLPSAIDTLALQRSEAVADAQVVDARTVATKYGMSYELRYVFLVGADHREVKRSDFLGRTDLWSSLPQGTWDLALKSKIVKVRYDLQNPGNNAPAAKLPDLADDLTPVGLGFVLLALAIIGGYGWWKERRQDFTGTFRASQDGPNLE